MLDRMRAFLALLALSLVACTKHTKSPPPAVAALDKLAESPSKMVLYSLNPVNNHDRHLTTDTIFDGFDILGKAEIADRNEQQSLLRALAHGASENHGEINLCFRPRHALHIEQDGKAIDFTICFECLQVETRGFDPGAFLTTASTQSAFDQSLQAHHLPSAPK